VPALTPRILFVERDESLRLLVQRVLSRHAITVDSVAEPQEAIRHLAEATYRVVVVDLMPNADAAYEVVRALSRIPAMQRPIIVATGDPFPDARLDAEVISLIVRKPYDVQSLAEMIVASIAVAIAGPLDAQYDHEMPAC
jgi:CheY-like chemotaxis protein